MSTGTPEGETGGSWYSNGSLQEALGPIRPKADVIKIVIAIQMSDFLLGPVGPRASWQDHHLTKNWLLKNSLQHGIQIVKKRSEKVHSPIRYGALCLDSSVCKFVHILWRSLSCECSIHTNLLERLICTLGLGSAHHIIMIKIIVARRWYIDYHIWHAVLGIRIRICRIHIFWGLPDPDPLIRGMDPDPSLFS